MLLGATFQSLIACILDPCSLPAFRKACKGIFCREHLVAGERFPADLAVTLLILSVKRSWVYEHF